LASAGGLHTALKLASPFLVPYRFLSLPVTSASPCFFSRLNVRVYSFSLLIPSRSLLFLSCSRVSFFVSLDFSYTLMVRSAVLLLGVDTSTDLRRSLLLRARELGDRALYGLAF